MGERGAHQNQEAARGQQASARDNMRIPPAIPRSLGKRRYKGICPPSNPGLGVLPDLAFWPRIPAPQLPPCSIRFFHLTM